MLVEKEITMKMIRRNDRRIAGLRHEIRRLRLAISRVHEVGLPDTRARLVERLEIAKARVCRLRRDAERRSSVA